MEDSLHAQQVLILDYGSQYTQLIARRVRELGVFCQIKPGQWSEDSIKDLNPNAIILSGGPQSVLGEGSPRIPACVFNMGVPVLGICYGMQAMMQALGGEVSSGGAPEYGPAQVTIHKAGGLFDDICDELAASGESAVSVWMSHGDRVDALAPGFETLASNDDTPHAAVADVSRHFYGIQFHPEVTHTPQGGRMLSHFLFDIAGLAKNWQTDRIIEEQVALIREQVGNDRVLVALSGGVDSAVVAALIHRAIGDQLTCLFVDTGLLRYQEREQVEQVFKNHFGMDLHIADASDRFFHALAGANDPEEKRRIIGHEFIAVFDEETKRLGANIPWLAQGTIYPDVIESAADSGHSEVIKSHHNVGGLPDDMPFQLVEPIRELFKDEVRKVGLALGLPAELIQRHPFPGPGLAVRSLGEVTREYASILARADHCFLSVLREHGYYDKVSQAFAVFMPVKAVGVKGDARHYGYVIALRAVTTIDFMTADWATLPAELLQEASHRIIAEVPEVARVVYDITSKPPGTIEWE